MRRFPKLVGGRLCLDFANTAQPLADDHRRDVLRGYADLVHWGRYAGAVDDPTAERLLRAAGARAAAARSSFAAALTLREAIHRVFGAVAEGATPAAADLASLRDAYTRAMRHALLLPGQGRFAWSWEQGGGESGALDRAWWPMARSAVELATGGPLERLKRCPPPDGCSFLFVDTSKNRIRRWCSMDDCGAAAKARRQTARRRADRARGG
jgi:predicted RNA-binding Zn ribbon-like protein